MESRRRAVATLPQFLLAVALFLMVFAAAPVSGNKYTVGDSKAWNPNVNYTEWVKKHAPFYIGDWLVFYYSSGQADVVQVDEAAYNKCDAAHPISNYSKGRSYAFELNETKHYYFICSFGYCYQGMKLAVQVHALPPPSPPPKPSAASHPRGSLAAVSAAAVSAVAAAVLRLL